MKGFTAFSLKLLMENLFTLIFLQAVKLSEVAWMRDAWQWSVPLAVIGLIGLAWAIYRLVKMIGKAKICRVPLAAESLIDINAAGRFNLCLEVPMFKESTTGNLDYELTDERHEGQKINLSRHFAGMRTNDGYSRTFAVREFRLTTAGKYRLKIAGLNPQADYSECFIVVSRPILLKSFFAILSIILASFLFIGGLIFSVTSFNINK